MPSRARSLTVVESRASEREASRAAAPLAPTSLTSIVTCVATPRTPEHRCRPARSAGATSLDRAQGGPAPISLPSRHSSPVSCGHLSFERAPSPLSRRPGRPACPRRQEGGPLDVNQDDWRLRLLPHLVCLSLEPAGDRFPGVPERFIFGFALRHASRKCGALGDDEAIFTGSQNNSELHDAPPRSQSYCESGLYLWRRCQRVFLSILRCLCLLIFLRRFLTTEPMKPPDRTRNREQGLFSSRLFRVPCFLLLDSYSGSNFRSAISDVTLS